MPIPTLWKNLVKGPISIISVDLCPEYGNRRTYAGKDGKPPTYLAASDYYETHTVEEMAAWGELVRPILAPVAVGVFWITKPRIEDYMQVIRAWGFEPATCGWSWIKCSTNHWDELNNILTQGSLFGGNILEHLEAKHFRPYDEKGDVVRPMMRWLISKLGGHWTQANTEDAWIGVYKAKGHKSDSLSEHNLIPTTLTYQPIFTPKPKQHSRKPEEMQSRMEIAWSNIDGPWVELFATRERNDVELPHSHLRKDWICLGNDPDLDHPMQIEESLPMIEELIKCRQ